MGYTVHDWFDDEFTCSRIKEFIRSCSTEQNLVDLLKGTLSLGGYGFDSQSNENALIMGLAEALFSLDKVYDLQDKFEYFFKLLEPSKDLDEMLYKTHLAEVSCKFDNKAQITFSSLFSFKRVRGYNFGDLVKALQDNEESDGSGSYLSSFDILIDYVKGLSNRDLLRDLIAGIVYNRFDADDLSEISLRMSYIFGMLVYDEQIELSSFSYSEGGSEVSVKYIDLD